MATKKNKTTKTAKPVPMRNGEPLTKLAKGDKRRLADGRNAWRKMTPAQRRVFVDWMAAEALAVADAPDPCEACSSYPCDCESYQ